jgi:hypothetical protein
MKNVFVSTYALILFFATSLPAFTQAKTIKPNNTQPKMEGHGRPFPQQGRNPYSNQGGAWRRKNSK